jgi:hypothetical protein
MKPACGMSQSPPIRLMHEEQDGLEHRGNGGRLRYGLRHDRLVASKYEGRFCCKDAHVHIFEARSPEPDLKQQEGDCTNTRPSPRQSAIMRLPNT